ncbi:hypothetical protein AGMMS49965_16580 [Bacteroidia bacterium]|nr:hypothetical protein AGMMS49965_16580 [Bacteroidia bacterium]
MYWLNGTLEKDSIRNQIEMLHQNGFKGIAPLPLSHITPSTRPVYLSDEYFEMYKLMLDELAARDMELVLYDDNDFPSGTAGGQMKELYPELMGKYLVRIDTILNGGEIKNIRTPEGKLMSACLSEPNETHFRAITGNVKITSDGTGGNAQVEIPAGQWRLQLFFCCVDKRYRTVDFLSPAAVEKLSELTYDEYYKRFSEYFGSTIHTTFYDDLSYWQVSDARAWTDGFNQKFEELYGFAPDALYPSLFEDTGDNTAINRVHLFGFRDQLFAGGYPRVISQWAAKHNVACSGHPAATYRPNPLQNMGDGLLYFKYQDVPLCDYIHYFRHGIDGFKVPASAACNYDKSTLICEIYGNFIPDIYNDGDMLYRAAMDVYARGINKLLPHGTWYDASSVAIVPEISWRNPAMAGSLKDYNEWASRCELILQNSRHVAQVGILYPIADLQARYNFLDYKLTNGRESIRGNDYFNLIGWMTTKLRVDYTLLHPETLDQRCIVKQGGILRLDNPNNYEEYSLLIVPWSKTIHLTNLAKIEKFVNNGGVVLFAGCLPEQSAGYSEDKQVRDMVTLLMQHDNVHFIEQPDEHRIKDFIAQYLVKPVVRVGNVKVTKEAAPNHADWPESFRDTDYAYNYIHKVKDGKDFFFFANPTDCHLSAEISFKPDKRKKAELWNPHTGKIEKLKYRTSGGRIWITLPLAPVESRFIVLK